MALCIIAVVAILFGGALDGLGGGFGGGGNGDAERNEFIEGLGGVSETFDGVVSRDTYPSSTMAAEAFIRDEVAGEAKAIIRETVSNGELSEIEIRATKIPERLLVGANAVEEIEVEYEISNAAALTRSGADGVSETSGTKRIKVYVIKYESRWKYFAPMPETDETISRSYYDSVFNSEKYKNCTFENNAVVDINVVGGGETMNMKMTTRQLIKHADGKVYLEQTISNEGSMAESNESVTICAYLEDNYGRIKCYVKMDADGESTGWVEGDLSTVGFTSLEELTPFHDQYLDYTYFTKTDYGFALGQESAKKYFMQALGANLEAMGLNMNMDGINLDMFAEYYVQEGVLSGMRLDADFEWTLSVAGESGTIKETAVTELKCTNYGTTVVENPMK
jgi:hypothetical protein